MSHLQVGEGEQVHIPAGRVHSVATLGPRVCLSLYSTAAFGKGKEDKSKKKVVDKAAEKEMADESTKAYVTSETEVPEGEEEGEGGGGSAESSAEDQKKKNKRE